MDFKQMELDLRLQPERDLDENISILMAFAHHQLVLAEDGFPVKNRHEGYGILAEHFVLINGAMKDVKNGMANLLRVLPVDDYKAADAVSSIDNSLAELIKAATRMSAEAKRIADDLFNSASTEKTPMEEYMEEAGGFEEAPDGGDGNGEGSKDGCEDHD